MQLKQDRASRVGVRPLIRASRGGPPPAMQCGSDLGGHFGSRKADLTDAAFASALLGRESRGEASVRSPASTDPLLCSMVKANIVDRPEMTMDGGSETSDLSLEEQEMLKHIRGRKSQLLKDIEMLRKEIEEVTQEIERMDMPEEGKASSKQKKLVIGKKKFNMDPKKGIEYLIDEGLLQDSADGIAEFLYKGEGLNKTAIGNYLGEKSDMNLKVLSAFVRQHEFRNMLLVSALRQFLWSFRLPGEAQKIDRMMEAFAQRYCELNPDVFTSDTCYVLSFAIIMLNTSLHNPNVKEKPDIERFVSMNRGINNGKDLPRELIESLYDSIKKEPFKIPEDDGNDLMNTFFNPDKEGWLWKQGASKISGRYKNWKRRWFILSENCLYYFEFTTDKEPRGIIPLESLEVQEVDDPKRQHCFELHSATGSDFIKACKTDKDGRVVEGKHSVYKMSASTVEEKDDWIRCISASISENPFHHMLSARRQKVKKAGGQAS